MSTAPANENINMITVFLKPLSILPFVNASIKLSKLKKDSGNVNTLVDAYSVPVLNDAKSTVNIGNINTITNNIKNAYLHILYISSLGVNFFMLIP